MSIEFQSRYRAASHFRSAPRRLGYPPQLLRFNLVIERLLISGPPQFIVADHRSDVSISLSSGFSFQAFLCPFAIAIIPVSISLSSGFSFQAHDFNIEPTEGYLVSISLSSGFSFQEEIVDGWRITYDEVSISLSSGFSFQGNGATSHLSPA